MIGRIAGILLEKRPPQVLLDVQGVGYELDVPMTTFYQLPALGERVVLHTHLLVRDDAHLLFGFGSEPERQAFRQLLKVTGIGSRIALAVLSGLSVSELRSAVSAQETGQLTRIPGVGKKTAERLLLELKDKLDNFVADPSAATPPPEGDVLNALTALGYNEREARWAINQLSAELPVAEGIRQALKLLSKK